MNRRTYNADGQLIYSETYDLDAGTVTIGDAGTVAVEQVPPALLAVLISERAAIQRTQRLAVAAETLREWAAEAAAVNVGPMNVTQHKAVTQTMLTRVGVFFDRFADLLDER